MSVYKCINKVQAALAQTGISKDRKSQQGSGYMFRGIDDVYNAIAPLLAEHGLCILPRMMARTCEERASKSNTALFYVTVEAEFDFVCADDGTKHTVRTFGEAMDSGDKATNKAMSAAYKYAAFQAFAIPTEGDNDADSSTHEVQRKPEQKPAIKHKPTDGAMVSTERRHVIADVAMAIVDRMNNDDVAGAFGEAQGITDAEEKTLLWGMLSAPTRRAIKEFSQQIKETA